MSISQIARRRSFAIISHPDAGKTTLTEKLLLYGGAINLAGSVTSRKNQRSATSDWMELEKQRGISVTSTVLQFEYDGHCLNLLDTPGHRDFSEDTYRVLTAVDSVVMVIDAGKGIETQTRKLFEICRQRKIPIITFINKLDQPGKWPLDLLDELESVLGIHSYAMNYPLGTGREFKGIYSRNDKQAHFFKRTPGGSFRAPERISSLADAHVREELGDTLFEQVSEELSLLEGAGADFDEAKVRAGELSPVFFGSAMNNFGVQLLLDAVVKYGLPPQPRESTLGTVQPSDPAFSGFIFKIQANMDARHRDRIAFVRICSGKFEREMNVNIARTGKSIRLKSAHRLFGQDRETVDEAWPGDIIGIVGHSDLSIGDTLTEKPGLIFHALPRFAPEVFAYLHSDNTSQFKRFRDGLDQLLQEGVIQVLRTPGAATRVPLLGVVGPLQFDVVQYRLKAEYGVDSRLDRSTWSIMRWLDQDFTRERVDAEVTMPTGTLLTQDQSDRLAVLFESEWVFRYFVEKNPKLTLHVAMGGDTVQA